MLKELNQQIMDELEARKSLYEHRQSLALEKDSVIKDWNRVRALIEHEDDLIHQRTTWLITSNAFLFTGYFLSQGSVKTENSSELTNYLIWLIPLISIVLSYTIKAGIEAAMSQIKTTNGWWEWRKSLDMSNYEISTDDALCLKHPRLTGITPDKFFDHDFMISKAIPWTLILSWIFILAGLFWKTINANLPIVFPIWGWGVLGLITTLLPFLVGRWTKLSSKLRK